MCEIAHTFRGIERPNVGPDTSLQPFDCALRSFAQESLQRMKNHLDWIEIWRIRRQVAQCCCVKKTRRRHAVREMKEGPSEPPCRRRLQTATSCFGQKPRW